MSTRQPDVLAAVRGGRLIIAVVLGVALLAALARAFTGFYVEVLWQAETGYLPVFWRRLTWEVGVRTLAGVAVGILVYVNLKVASTTLGGIQIRRRFGNLEISEQIPRRYVTWAMASAAGVLGLWFGASVTPGIGRQVLTAMAAPAWGVTDPILNRDLGFYVFWIPVLQSALVYTLTTAFLMFTLATAGYAATGALTWSRGRVQAQQVARVHLGSILAVFFVLLAAQLKLSQFSLLMDGNSSVQGIFGFADAQARMPAFQTLSVLCLAAAAGAAWGAWKNRPWPIFGAFLTVILGSMLIGNLYPSLIQSFRVEPNELERERPYIEHSLEFTRTAFGLHEMDRRGYEYAASDPIDWELAARQFAGLPVWNEGPLLTTFREIEARYPYYEFDDVTIDRYDTPAGPVPVAISVRQIDPAGIQDDNWQNLHLRELYVAGLGAVASVATTRSPEGRPEMVLSPEVRSGERGIASLRLDRPQIYYGTHPQEEYAVATSGPTQYLAPDGSPGVPGIDFPRGIPLAGGIRTALLAWRFRAVNLLFSSELNDDSRLIYRRRVMERALAIAPFLRFAEQPYPVVADGRVVWILEGFSGTLAYPLAATYDFGDIRTRVNYVRNSVKVTVDAVTGAIDFYRVPIPDPLTDAYEAAYPGLLRPISEMPETLREHLRYPKTLLDLQSRVLLQYHQETAQAFHGQQDVWREPQELADSPSPVPYRAEYGIYRLPDEDDARFQLTTVFVPAGRENLTSMLVARVDGLGVPETILMDVPVADQVLGPRQVEVQIEQDPLISQQFSLWRTGGSRVWTGHLHLVPVGRRLLYMEPIFLAAEEDAIPPLRRFVISDGVNVVMAETLEMAIAQMAGSGYSQPAPSPTSGTQTSGEAGVASDPAGAWPAAALDLLERAEASARAGDWQGYGQALEELRALLTRLGAGGG